MRASDYETLPDAVQWSEGMLLTPQHFQQQDIYWNYALRLQSRGLSAHHWGLLDLRLDLPLLALGRIEIQKLSCIFPDGTPFILKHDSTKLSLTLEKDKTPGGEVLLIYVGMPPRTGSMKVQTTSIRRYENIHDETPVIDEMTGLADVVIDRIRPSVKLYLEKNIPSGYDRLPLFEVRKHLHSNQFELTSFHPPMLRIGVSECMPVGVGLYGQIQKLRDSMWDKLQELMGTLPANETDETITLNQDEKIQLGWARYLASVIPSFEAIALDKESSPVQVYHALSEAVGRMSWIGNNPMPQRLLPYRHEDCAEQFQMAIEYITNKLTLIRPKWARLDFIQINETCFARNLPDNVSTSVLIEVRLREGQGLNDVEKWLSDSRIGSENIQLSLRQRRLPGATRYLLSSAEVTKLGLRSNAIVIRLDNQQIDMPKGNGIDCLGAGENLQIQSNNVQFVPAGLCLLYLRQTP